MLWATPGFERGDERPSGSGIPLLFPFPGRIRGARYEFGGRPFQLEPGDAFGNAIHGFVFKRPWRVVEQTAARVVGEFQAAKDDPALLDRWPSDFLIRVSYEVRGSELQSEVYYANTGEGSLPCGFATHAYFRLPLAESGRAADTLVTVPAGAWWELVEELVPTGRVLPLVAGEDLSGGLLLGEHTFNTVFTKLQADANGRIGTSLRNLATGRELSQTFDDVFTQCVVYTPDHREAICMEPYTCVPDAIRLSAAGHATGLQVLRPGEHFSTKLAIRVA